MVANQDRRKRQRYSLCPNYLMTLLTRSRCLITRGISSCGHGKMQWNHPQPSSRLFPLPAALAEAWPAVRPRDSARSSPSLIQE